jgi:hypothetical protein
LGGVLFLSFSLMCLLLSSFLIVFLYSTPLSLSLLIFQTQKNKTNNCTFFPPSISLILSSLPSSLSFRLCVCMCVCVCVYVRTRAHPPPSDVCVCVCVCMQTSSNPQPRVQRHMISM